jgi:hypothetical protein
MMSADAALAFIEKHGVVLVAGKGPVPRLVEAIVGEPIRGSWWAHPASHRIFAVLQALEASGELLPCRLIAGKGTLVHRRLRPPQHTASGKHVNRAVDFPQWVPAGVRAAARHLSIEEAERVLAPALGRAQRR